MEPCTQASLRPGPSGRGKVRDRSKMRSHLRKVAVNSLGCGVQRKAVRETALTNIWRRGMWAKGEAEKKKSIRSQWKLEEETTVMENR